MRSNTAVHTPRIVATLPFVEQLARRVAATMPHSIDIGDLVQDGVLGLIDAANRFDEARGIKFETFAERRIRGAMIDALRKDAWPRGVRRQRRELEAAREELRREMGCEPSLADLATKMGSDEKRLGRTIVRIKAIESTSPLANNEHLSEASLPAALIPSEPESPDSAYERAETSSLVRAAIASLPQREQKVISLYYFQEATMKQIGAEIGVNESRVSQLHARAIRRLKDALNSTLSPTEAASATASVLAFHQKSRQAAVASTPRHLTLVNPARRTPAVIVAHPSAPHGASTTRGSAHRVSTKRRASVSASLAKVPRRQADVVAMAR
jgi:RNA polymerase sigma factor for flagellar operon FliA